MGTDVIFFYLVATILVAIEKRAVIGHGVVSGMLFYFLVTSPADAMLVVTHTVDITPVVELSHSKEFTSPYSYNEAEIPPAFWDVIAKYRGEAASERCKGVEPIARNVGKKYDISPQLLLAIAAFESGCNNSAVSSAGALCMSQIMPFWVEYNREDMLRLTSDPEYCLSWSAYILKLHPPTPWYNPIERYYGEYHEDYINAVGEMLRAAGWDEAGTHEIDRTGMVGWFSYRHGNSSDPEYTLTQGILKP